MNITAKTRHLQIGRYSQIVPPDVKLTEQHVIFNASRPLPGHVTWQGDFCHGIFYSAVDVTKPDAARLARQCIDLDGWALAFIAETTATQAVQAWWDANANALADISIVRYDLIWQSYLQHCAPDTVMLEVNDSSWKE